MNRIKAGSMAPVAIAAMMAVCSAAWAQDSKPVVKIAFIAPLTGPNAPGGIGGKNSFALALKQHNQSPGAKYHYVGEFLDDQCKAEPAVQAALKAGSDPSVISAIANYCSISTVAALPVYHKQHLPATIWASTLPSLTYGQDYVEITRVNGNQKGQNELAAKFDADVLKVKTVACLYTTDAYGKGMFEYYSEAAKKNGLKLVYTAGVRPGQMSFTAQFAHIASMNPDVVWYGGQVSTGVAIRNQMASSGVKAIFQGTSGLLAPEYIVATGKNAEGTLSFTSTPVIDELPDGPKFLKAYTAAGYKEAPQAYGPFAYAAAMLQMRAIDAVGPDRTKVAEYLHGDTKDVPSLVGPITFDSHGQNVNVKYTSYVVQDGKYVSWKKSEYATGSRKLP
jgi:branched-chain amino acid transport system substrate-binding protein